MNPPGSPMLYKWVFDKFILAHKAFAKGLPRFETFALVDNNVSEKATSSLQLKIKFNKRFKVALVAFLAPDLNLVICDLDHFTFKCYIESFDFDIILQQSKFTRPSFRKT